MSKLKTLLKLKIKVIIGVAALVFMVLFISIITSEKHRKGKTIDEVSVPVLTRVEERSLKLHLNEEHVALAKEYGIEKPITSAKDFMTDEEGNSSKNDLVKIVDCNYYIVGHLTHSLSYQKDFVADFLTELGQRFDDKLRDEGLIQYRFVITSLLRTLEDQRKLQKLNVNATPNTTSHYFGNALDICQTRFVTIDSRESLYEYRLRNILARTILELQAEGKCYVVMETREKCFHITIRG